MPMFARAPKRQVVPVRQGWQRAFNGTSTRSQRKMVYEKGTTTEITLRNLLNEEPTTAVKHEPQLRTGIDVDLEF